MKIFNCPHLFIYVALNVFLLPIFLPIDTPAHRCGVQPGDEITQVNDVSLYRVSIEESKALLDKVGVYVCTIRYYFLLFFSNFQAITQKKLSLSIHRDTLSNPKSLDQRHSVATVTHHNGIPNNHTSHNHYPSSSNNSGYTRIRSLSSGMDLKRVHSDALPKHQIASTCTVEESHSTTAMTTEMVDLNRDDEELNRTLTSIDDDNDEDHAKVNGVPPSELGKSKEAPAVFGRSQHHPDYQSTISHEQFRTRSPLDYLKDEEAFKSGGPGKSQSVTELSTISPVPSLHTRDKSDTGVTSYFKSHGRAKKTESLPGKIRAQSLNFKDSSSSNRSSVSTPSVGLGLQHMSIDDMPGASKLQIDQIWKEVEGSSCVVSPVDDAPLRGEDATLRENPLQNLDMLYNRMSLSASNDDIELHDHDATITESIDSDVEERTLPSEMRFVASMYAV